MKILLFLPLLLLINMNDIQGQDWPNLTRFQTQNNALATSDNDGKRIVFMGNSITEGWLGDSTSFFYSKSYINRGIGGQTTPQMLIRFKQDVVELQPKVVVILAGINDIAGNTGPSTLSMIMNNISAMAEVAAANGISVVLSSVLPAAHFPWRPEIQPAAKVIELNEMIMTYANGKGHVYLDYFSMMVDNKDGLKDELTYDGVHPNLKGYKVMAPLAEAAIQKALKKALQ